MSKTSPISALQPEKHVSPAVFWALFIFLIGFAAFIRFYDLKADPPAFFAKGTQDLTTDGAYLTLHAKQAVLYGQWDLFGFKRWTAFKISIISGVSYLLFEIFGVSRATANAAGALLGFGGILFFIAALWRGRSRKFILLLSLFLCSSFMLTTYGRLPLSEDGLLFLAGLLFFSYSMWFEKIWGKVVVGILVALCGLLGKGFGFLLGAGPLVFILMSESKTRLKDVILLFVPFAAAFSLFWVLFYQDQGFFTFLWEHGAGVHGFPHGFMSPMGFFEALISYGRYGLHTYSIVVSLVCYISFLTLLLGKWKEAATDKTTVFVVTWFFIWILALAPFNYLPLRYLFLLFVPMSILAASYLANLRENFIGGFGNVSWWRLLLLLLVNWMMLYNVCMDFVIPRQILAAYYRTVWLILPFAIILTLLMFLVLRQKRITFSGRSSAVLTLIVILGVIATEGYHQSRWLSQRIYTISYGNRDVTALIDPSAVVAGQDGPAFTANSKIRNFPLFVTEDVNDLRRQLAEYPITHLIIGNNEWEALVKSDSSFFQGRPLTRFWVRDAIVVLVRVAGIVKNPQTDGYVLSDYEKADMAMVRNEQDSVEFYLRRFVAAHPECRAGLSDLYYHNLQYGKLEDQRQLVEQIVTVLPTDFAANLLGAIYYKRLYPLSHSLEDQKRSEELLRRAIALNPVNEENLKRLYQTAKPQERML